MRIHSKAGVKDGGVKKRKREANLEPSIAITNKSNDSVEDRKPFKSYQGKNKWTPKSNILSKAVDTDSTNWYNSVPQDPKEYPTCKPDEVTQLKETAKGMLQLEISTNVAKASKNSSKAWIQTAMTQGVGRDKIAAMLLALQEEPMYNLSALQRLISFVKPGNMNCSNVLDMLTEVFVTNLLPPSQPLRSFNKRPLALIDELSANNPAGRRRRLVAWYFEDQLKYQYRSYVDAVSHISTNGNDEDKIKAVSALARLLAANPEHEEILLSALVNKLGDSNSKVRGKANQSLNGVLKVHPVMKGVVVDEVERMLFRPNISYKTQLTAVDFLTSVIFQAADSEVALHLLKIYFSLFKRCVKEGIVDTRLFRTLLRGVKRAYPFAHETIESISEHMETLHRIVHIAPFSIALQALSLLFMVADYKASVSDRFYTALYEKILDPELAVTRDQNEFVQLLYSALKKDTNSERVRAFVKRLLQVCLYLPVQVTCSLLYMISQLISGRQSLEPNAFVKLDKSDVKTEVPFSCFDEDDDGEEHYDDVVENEKEKPERKHPVAGWVFRPKIENKVKRSDSYDLRARNPAFAQAVYAFYDELYPLLRHFHPSVVKFATQIHEGSTISYDGNPLIDFSLSRFLERFSFKNPKKVEVKDIPHRQQYSVKGVKAIPVMSRRYITMNENQVPADEHFLHKYLHNRYAARIENEDNEEDDGDSVASEEYEEIMRGFMSKKDRMEEEDEEDLDYAADVDKTIASQKDKKKAKRKVSDEEEEEDDEDISSDDGEGGSGVDDASELDELDELSMDEDDDFSDDNDDGGARKSKVRDEEDFGDLSDEDKEVIDFDGDDDDDDLPIKKKLKKMKGDVDFGPTSSVFASSDKFAELIEATAAAGRTGGSDDIINSDNSHAKQLRWEKQRDFSSKKNWSHKKKFGKGPATNKGSFKKTNNKKGGKKFAQKKFGRRS